MDWWWDMRKKAVRTSRFLTSATRKRELLRTEREAIRGAGWRKIQEFGCGDLHSRFLLDIQVERPGRQSGI